MKQTAWNKWLDFIKYGGKQDFLDRWQNKNERINENKHLVPHAKKAYTKIIQKEIKKLELERKQKLENVIAYFSERD